MPSQSTEVTSHYLIYLARRHSAIEKELSNTPPYLTERISELKKKKLALKDMMARHQKQARIAA